MLKSLQSRKHTLANPIRQVEVLEQAVGEGIGLPGFERRLKQMGQYPLVPDRLQIFQVNIGYMCNQVCKHCHVDAGPDRTEAMSRETMQMCLEIIHKTGIPTLDITGGAPEMNSDFRWFVAQARAIGVQEIIVRSNLTIIVSNPKYRDLPEFFRDHNVRVCSSLPFYQSDKTDRQRGEGVFAKSIESLKLLNAVGYGKELVLDLVYNPAGAFLPGSQKELEALFKKELMLQYGVVFNSLLTITNIPVSRFLDYLLTSGNYDEYMEKLVLAFNPATVPGLMCRNTISVDWQGYLYDCDFNQILGLKTEFSAGQHLRDFDLELLERRKIVTGQHCYGCTAGAGSSCQGATAEVSSD